MRGISGLDRPIVQWAFVGVAAVLIAASVWTGVALVRARRAIAQARDEAAQARIDLDRAQEALARERAARESFQLQLGRERQSASTAPPTLTLEPLKRRSPQGPELAVPSPAAPLVELRLVLPERASGDAPLTIALRSWTTGETLWSRGSVRATRPNGKPAAVVQVASDVLQPGPYELLVTAGNPASEVASYEFSIVARGADR